MPDSRRKFDPEFREGAVRIVRETGKPIAQIARGLGVYPGVPHTVTCAILGISISWFYKWFGRGPTDGSRRRAALDAKVRTLFTASKGAYGSPRIHADLLEAGETVGVNTVAESMRRQGLAGRKPKRSRGLTRQDRTAPKFPDLVRRDFIAPAPNLKWCGDVTEIPTEEGKLYFASVLDLHSRRLLASATSDHPDADLACDAIKMAAAVCGGRAVIDGVIFHTDRGSSYTARCFTTLCRTLGVSQSNGKGRFMFR
jgi:transposase InsO family protein